MMYTDLLPGDTFLKEAHGIIIFLHADGALSFINDHGKRLLEAFPEELTGLNWIENFVQPSDREKSSDLFENLKRGGSLHGAYQNTLITRKGNRLIINWYKTMLIVPAENIQGLLCFGEDVTEKNLLTRKLLLGEQTKKKELLQAIIKAQEEERRSLAHELHDNINQLLSTAKLLLDQEIYMGSVSPFVTKARDVLLTGISEIRNLSHQLDPIYLEGSMLFDALKEMVSQFNLAKNIKLRLDIFGEKNSSLLEAPLSLDIYRIFQEALNNMAKYSGAREGILTIYLTEKAIDAEIFDNGNGFDLPSVKKGLGLRSIYARVDRQKGTIYINTSPGEGCFISLHFPLIHEK